MLVDPTDSPTSAGWPPLRFGALGPSYLHVIYQTEKIAKASSQLNLCKKAYIPAKPIHFESIALEAPK